MTERIDGMVAVGNYFFAKVAYFKDVGHGNCPVRVSITHHCMVCDRVTEVFVKEFLKYTTLSGVANNLKNHGWYMPHDGAVLYDSTKAQLYYVKVDPSMRLVGHYHTG